jgi:hypothetical protein
MFRINLPELIGRAVVVEITRAVLHEDKPSINRQIIPYTAYFIEVIFLTFLIYRGSAAA